TNTVSKGIGSCITKRPRGPIVGSFVPTGTWWRKFDMNPPSTTLMHSSRNALFSGHDATEYARELRLPSFSATLELNSPGSHSNPLPSPQLHRLHSPPRSLLVTPHPP